MTHQVEFELRCCLCPRVHVGKVGVPDGWTETSLHSEAEFCPDHAIIDEWKSAQCPGCVAGWGECPLWKGFAYERYRHNMADTLTEAELRKVACGECPRRVNGTFFSNGQSFGELNISEKAAYAPGEALVQAIRDYWTKYPNCSPEYDPRKPAGNLTD
jgi:hypothetical protein